VIILEAQSELKQGLEVAFEPELNTTPPIRIGHFDSAETCSASKLNWKAGILR